MEHEGGPAQRTKVAGTPSGKGRATKVGKVGRGLIYYREYQTRTATLNSMRYLKGSQWRDILHIGRNMVKFRNRPIRRAAECRMSSRQFRRVAGLPASRLN